MLIVKIVIPATLCLSLLSLANFLTFLSSRFITFPVFLLLSFCFPFPLLRHVLFVTPILLLVVFSPFSPYSSFLSLFLLSLSFPLISLPLLSSHRPIYFFLLIKSKSQVILQNTVMLPKISWHLALKFFKSLTCDHFLKVFNNMILIPLTAFLFSAFPLVVSAETCELFWNWYECLYRNEII